jgi:hypothetical protein
MTRIEVTRHGYLVWLRSRLRKRWEMPLSCATLIEALRISEKLGV